MPHEHVIIHRQMANNQKTSILTVVLEELKTFSCPNILEDLSPRRLRGPRGLKPSEPTLEDLKHLGNSII